MRKTRIFSTLLFLSFAYVPITMAASTCPESPGYVTCTNGTWNRVLENDSAGWQASNPTFQGACTSNVRYPYKFSAAMYWRGSGHLYIKEITCAYLLPDKSPITDRLLLVSANYIYDETLPGNKWLPATDAGGGYVCFSSIRTDCPIEPKVEEK